jgi:hypothetical protein
VVSAVVSVGCFCFFTLAVNRSFITSSMTALGTKFASTTGGYMVDRIDPRPNTKFWAGTSRRQPTCDDHVQSVIKGRHDELVSNGATKPNDDLSYQNVLILMTR